MEKPPLVSNTCIGTLYKSLVQSSIIRLIRQVKRLTMGLLRAAEDSRPLVHTSSLSTTPFSQDGYVNESVINCDPDRIIASTFGDSCRTTLNQSGTIVVHQTHHTPGSTQSNNVSSGGIVGNNEFEYKRNIFHETHSGMLAFHFIIYYIYLPPLAIL